MAINNKSKRCDQRVYLGWPACGWPWQISYIFKPSTEPSKDVRTLNWREPNSIAGPETDSFLEHLQLKKRLEANKLAFTSSGEAGGMRVAVTLLTLFFFLVVVPAREEKTNCATGMIRYLLTNLLICQQILIGGVEKNEWSVWSIINYCRRDIKKRSLYRDGSC